MLNNIRDEWSVASRVGRRRTVGAAMISGLGNGCGLDCGCSE
jgi:hypothetical protein